MVEPVIGHQRSGTAGRQPWGPGLPMMLTVFTLIVGVLWMHGASAGHHGMPTGPEHMAAAACPHLPGSPCPDEPAHHDGTACQVTVAAPAAIPAPATAIFYLAVPRGESRRAAVITAVDAAGGSGCGPPSLTALSILRI